jgi:hypothetical protein
MNNQEVKHDIENSSIVITRLSKAIAPAMKNMIEYIRAEKAYHVVSERQLEILERSLCAITDETQKLALLTMKIMADYEGKNEDV